MDSGVLRPKSASIGTGQKRQEAEPMTSDSFPVYLLRSEQGWEVVYPEGKRDIGHTDFWEDTVSRLVARRYRIPRTELVNLPYCQLRARIVGDTVYFGEQPDPGLLQAIRKAVGNDRLAFAHDDHERRLKEDVAAFRRLVKRYRPGSTAT
jgi:hypothetical protein